MVCSQRKINEAGFGTACGIRTTDREEIVFMKTIVSLTSYPPRICGVHKVIESLYRQTIPADEIILYLSLEEFPEMEAGLPEALRRLNGQKGFRIEWVQGNLKSHKKYYYALQQYKDAAVITVDDDTIYAETMISELIESHKRFPDAVSARKVRIILKCGEVLAPYSKWTRGEYLDEYIDEYIDVPRMDLCAIGSGGICYPAMNHDHWFDEEMMLKIAGEQDDLWLKYNQLADNIPVVYTKASQKDITIEDAQINQLTSNNLYGGKNDICIHALSELLKEQDENVYQKWFQNLMTWEELFTEKKKYYLSIYNAVFDELGDMPVYVLGRGITAQKFLMALADLGLIHRIESVISLGESGYHLHGLQVRSLSEINKDNEMGVILGAHRKYREKFINSLTGYNYRIIELDMKIIKFY